MCLTHTLVAALDALSAVFPASAEPTPVLNPVREAVRASSHSSSAVGGGGGGGGRGEGEETGAPRGATAPVAPHPVPPPPVSPAVVLVGAIRRVSLPNCPLSCVKLRRFSRMF